MDAARFARGLTYDEYKAQMTRNRERLEAYEANLVIDPRDLAYFKSLKTLKVMVLAEDWCGDVIANLPVLGRLAKECGTLDLRIFLRDQNPDLMKQYLNHGKHESIPLFAFFDESGREVGVFTERPAAVTERREEQRRAIYAAHPEFGSPDASTDSLSEDVRTKLMAAIAQMREELKPWADRQVVLAIRDVIARAPTV